MKKLTLLVALLTSSLSFTSSANILALLTIASPSHHIWNSPLLVALADKGHNVTIISAQAQKPHPNITDLVVTGLVEGVAEAYDYVAMADTVSAREWVYETFMFTLSGCKIVLNSKEFKHLLDHPPEKAYDLVIIESIGCECLFGILHKFGYPPMISGNAFLSPIWTLRQSGTPYMPSHMPYLYSLSSDHMTFTERVDNFLMFLYGNFYYYNTYMPQMNKLARGYFGKQIPLVEDTLKKVSLVFANMHPVLDYPWPMSPMFIPIGGVQVKEPKPLPPDLQKFIDEAKDGVIYFSLGSNIRSDSLSPKLRSQILEAFSQVPQRVLWKFESGMSDLPKNVRVGKWLPQTDILAHPNVKLFITHSGGLSTHETVYRGVPVVSIPFLADQFIHSKRVVSHGGGVSIQVKDLNKDTLLNAIQTVINNPSYAENMKALSLRFRDNQQTPLDKAVYWAEYVLRHKGAAHLRTAALDLNTFQYFLLDVIAFLLAIPAFIIIVFYYICCRRRQQEPKKLKKN